MTPLEQALKKAFADSARFDPITKRSYSVDASIFEVEPLAIVYPKNSEDIERLVAIAKSFKVPLIARGAATGITGGCIGKGIIVDLSLHMTAIKKIDLENEMVTLEPGVVQDRLNEALSPYGYVLGPQTSTGNRATLGGMLANNSAGARSLKYGAMIDHILSLKMVLASGQTVTINKDNIPFANELAQLKLEYSEEIKQRFPKIPRLSSGYRLDALIQEPFNPCKLIAGSEGTLGIVTEMTLKIVKKPENLALCLLFFDDMLKAMEQIPALLEFSPFAIEMIDKKIIEMALLSPTCKDHLGWVQKNPECVFIAELEREKIDAFAKKTGGTPIFDPKQMKSVWEVRKAGLGLLLSKRSYSKAIAFIEDLSVHPKDLAPFFKEFLPYLKRLNKEAGIYGHVGSGCMHLRPYMDLGKEEEIVLMKKIMQDTCEMILESKGALSGEHGDGMLRAHLNQKLFGSKLYAAFVELKTLFDPERIMNPGKIIEGQGPDHHLRVSPENKLIEIPTYLDFKKEGGLAFAADMCNGNGQCRKKEGVMCPSFQATGDEFDTTRARAQALREIATGRKDLSSIASKELMEVLDLCLQCKGCKKECPSQVDMAKMKQEVLYQHHKKWGWSLRDLLLGNLSQVFLLAAPLASLFNRFNQTQMAKWLFKALGIAPNRPLPQLAKERFSSWFAKQEQKGEKKVVLFNDTFCELITPEVGMAAVNILNALGYHVIVPPFSCCGRTLLSKGMLEKANEKAKKVGSILEPYISQKIPIVGLEPSCILALKEEYQSLPCAINLSVETFDEFVARHPPLNYQRTDQKVLVHGHCHQKAIVGMDPTFKALAPFTNVHLIDSGCCGMAGAFGYEQEHALLSQKIANLKLVPKILSEKDAVVIASGLSCRSQIDLEANVRAYHLAEFLSNSL
jgi:FAD/FMN-containing dehydrogenase/Fe-S oxidoreductase